MLVGSQSVVASASWYAVCACQYPPVANLNLLYPLLPSLTLSLSRRGPNPPPCSVLPSTSFSPQASRRKDPQLIWHRRARNADNSGLRTVAQGTCSVQRRVLIVHMACVALTLQGALVPFTYSLARRSLTAYIPTLPLMRKTMQTRCRPRLPTHQRRPAPRCIHAIHVQIGFAQPPGPACDPAEPAHNHPLRNQYIYRRLMLPWVDFFSPLSLTFRILSLLIAGDALFAFFVFCLGVQPRPLPIAVVASLAQLP